MPHPVKAKKSSTARHEAIQGYLFVTPYLIAFTIFTGIPFVSAFVLSFLDVKFITRVDDVHFVAFKNFVRFFSNKEALAAPRPHRPVHPDLCAGHHGAQLHPGLSAEQGRLLGQGHPLDVLPALRLQHGGRRPSCSS